MNVPKRYFMYIHTPREYKHDKSGLKHIGKCRKMANTEVEVNRKEETDKLREKERGGERQTEAE
jgi:hypothetical protein